MSAELREIKVAITVYDSEKLPPDMSPDDVVDLVGKHVETALDRLPPWLRGCLACEPVVV